MMVWHGVALVSALFGGLSQPTFAEEDASSGSVRDWQMGVVSSVLGDGSQLNDYRAHTADKAGLGATMSASHHPRFRCESVFWISVSRRLLEPLPEEDSVLAMTIDGTPSDWLVVVDLIDDMAVISLEAGDEERRTLRSRLDDGDRVSLNLSEELTLEFSLLGSRRAMKQSRESCLDHEPGPWQHGQNGLSSAD